MVSRARIQYRGSSTGQVRGGETCDHEGFDQGGADRGREGFHGRRDKETAKAVPEGKERASRKVRGREAMQLQNGCGKRIGGGECLTTMI